MKAIDLTGQKFGRLTVIGVAPRQAGQKRPLWVCKCDCGRENRLLAYQLRAGKTKSCGCLAADNARARLMKHGYAAYAKTEPEYMVWAAMIKRCTNQNHDRYKRYGGRGISVCERWKDFRNFIADMGNRPSPIHSIERDRVDGNYEPGNCRWATPEEQASNRGDNRILELNGAKKTLSQWARDIGITHTSLAERIDSGRWSLEDALTTPRSRSQPISYNGLSMTGKQWAEYLGVAFSTIRQRIRLLPIEEALDPSKIRKSPTKKSA